MVPSGLKAIGGQQARARTEGQRAHAAGTLRRQGGAGLLLGDG